MAVPGGQDGARRAVANVGNFYAQHFRKWVLFRQQALKISHADAWRLGGGRWVRASAHGVSCELFPVCADLYPLLFRVTKEGA